jgi:nitrogenase molybdenum-cofactor synthesis protein NifE
MWKMWAATPVWRCFEMDLAYIVTLPGAPPAIFPPLAGVPGIQLLFVGPLACTRHGIYTSMLELREQLSFLCVSEADVVTGAYLDKAVQAAQEIARERAASCMILITCCQNALIGTDYSNLCARMTAAAGIPVRYLEVNRLQLYARRKGDAMSTPARELIYDFLDPAPRSPTPSVNVIGSPYGVDPACELFPLLHRAGIREVRELSACASFAEYRRMAGAHLNIVLQPDSASVGERLQERLGIPWLPLCSDGGPARLAAQYAMLGQTLGVSLNTVEQQLLLSRRATEMAARLSGAQLFLEGSASDAPLALARWLLGCGFHLTGIHLTNFSVQEPEVERDLRLRWPGFEIRRDTFHVSAPLDVPRILRGQRRPGRQSAGFLAFHRVLDLIERAVMEATQ